jgi:hypothetical protein
MGEIEESPSNVLGAMSFAEVEKLLEPLIDVAACERITLNRLRNNWKAVISKLYGTHLPMFLTLHSCRLLLCDPKTFHDLEERRRSLLAGCEAAGRRPQAGKLRAKLPDKRVAELAHMKLLIAAETRLLTTKRWDVSQTERTLSAMKAKADALTSALRHEENSEGHPEH